MMESRTSREIAAEEAIAWIVRQHEPGFGAADRRALSDWLLLSPLNVEEYLAASAAWGMLANANVTTSSRDELIATARADLAADVNVIPLRPANLRTVDVKPLRAIGRRRRVQVAAAIVLAIAAAAGLRLTVWTSTYATAHGELRSVTLIDGSVLMLNTDSKVRVRLRTHERDIELVRGEARFKVAKDPARPFVVTADNAEIRALGTVFNVRLNQGAAQVAVIEGRVAVRVTDRLPDAVGSSVANKDTNLRGLKSTVLDTGHRATVGGGAVAVGTGQRLESASAWTERKLVFREEMLASVIDEFNRYRLHPLVLDDAELGTMRISGVFSIEDPESLLAYLEGFETVEIRHGTDGSDHLLKAAIKP